MTHPIPGDRSGASRPLVIAIGNRFRGDDGVGGAVLDALAAHPKASALDLLELDGEPTRLIDAWDGRASVVLVDAIVVDAVVVDPTGVDAVATSGAPGEVMVLDDLESIERWHAGVSSHSVGLADAVRLGGVLDRLPGALAVVGVVVGKVADGPGLSPPVATAVPAAVEAVIARCGAGGSTPSPLSAG